MAEALDPSSTDNDQPTQWKPSSCCSRKSGYSNIFSGVNLHQLHRLFRTAGDRNAEHRAKLVWGKMDVGVEGTDDEKEQEEEEWDDEAGLAQALVGLRVRARNKAGIRAEGHRDNKWLKASGYLRVEEPLSGYASEEEETNMAQSLEEFQLPTEKDTPDNKNPFKPSSWRLDVRLDCAKDSDRYLHRILH